MGAIEAFQWAKTNEKVKKSLSFAFQCLLKAAEHSSQLEFHCNVKSSKSGCGGARLSPLLIFCQVLTAVLVSMCVATREGMSQGAGQGATALHHGDLVAGPSLPKVIFIVIGKSWAGL